VVLLGGRAAEELIFDDITTGASNDIERVTRMARKMVCEWGMSDVIGTLAIGETGEEVFIGREWIQNKNYSEDTARMVDAEVKRIVEEAHSRCRELLQGHSEALQRIAQALLERETINGEELDKIMNNEELPPLDTNGDKSSERGEDAGKNSGGPDAAPPDFVLEPDSPDKNQPRATKDADA
jgi:cell division protease FtsH